MPHFTKPPEGSWTEHYGLGTGPISYEDSISPEHYELERDAWVATVPVGYADGYPRTLSSRAEVLIGGRRCGAAGTVTMDHLMVDCGDLEPLPGDDVVLVGAQGDEMITAWELAERAGTLAYEIVTRIGDRVPREHDS